MSLRVLDPTAEEAVGTTTGPARLTSLAACTIGLLDNGKMRVRELLDHVEAMLRSQYGVAQVLRFKKPDASRPAPPQIMAAMKPCAAIISAVGD
jgi:hypothetical protein